MGTYFPAITDEQAALIESAALFFVASADPTLGSGPHGSGPVNVSPKGGVPVHLLGPNRVAYLDYMGSGNETARHIMAGGPITLMVCSFEPDQAAIVRLYGTATVAPLDESPLAALLCPPDDHDAPLRPRQIIDINIEQTQTSCGYGVPAMTFVRQRRKEDRGRRYKTYKRT